MLTMDRVAVSPDSLPERTDLAEIFDKDQPIELEIGCGKGGFLLRRARARPDLNLLGIEWANAYYKFAADRMARWGVANVRLLRTDAAHFVIHRLAPACLAAIHLYHPDPWPKKRHHKRRLFSADFVDAVARVLVPGGRLAVQTDHAEYFEQIRAVLGGRSELSPAAFDDPEFGIAGERTETNFEVKYLREGRPIFRLAFRRAT